MTKATKRNLFAELKEGFDALTASREGKITLETHAMELLPAPEVTARRTPKRAGQLRRFRGPGGGRRRFHLAKAARDLFWASLESC